MSVWRSHHESIADHDISNEDNKAGNGHHGWGNNGALDNLKALNVASGNAGDGGESSLHAAMHPLTVLPGDSSSGSAFGGSA